ncbi:Nucleoporin nup85, partial [Spiromyces aspiralis]
MDEKRSSNLVFSPAASYTVGEQCKDNGSSAPTSEVATRPQDAPPVDLLEIGNKPAVIALNPRLFSAERAAEWTQRNRTLLTDPHPYKPQVLACVGGKKPKELLPTPERVFDQDRVVYPVKWNPIPNYIRSFINSTHSTFQMLHDLVRAQLEDEEAIGRIGISHLKMIGGLYHDAMLRYLSVLQNGYDQDNAGIIDEIDKVESMIAIWELCIIVNFDLASPQDPVLAVILGWYNRYFSGPTTGEVQEIVASPNPMSHPSFWRCLNKAVLCGNAETASQLLNMVIESDSDASESAEEAKNCVTTMPRQEGDLSRTQYQSKWKEWHSRCRSIHQAMKGGEEEAEEVWAKLRQLMGLMCGDLEAVVKEADNWHEMLVAMLLYSEPATMVVSLPDLVDTCLSTFEAKDLNVFDHAIIALLTGNVGKFVLMSHQIHWWFAAHATNLLYHLDALDADSDLFPLDIHEYFLVMYAEMLISHPSLWRVALDYLAECPRSGTELLEH